MTSARPVQYAVLAIPGGRLTVIADDDVVVSSSFRGLDDARARVPGDRAVVRGPLDHVRDVLARYRDGDLHALEQVEVRQPGGAFQQRAWQAMRTIRAGSVDTYAGLARRAGHPRAARAAGTACSSNAVAPFVPCHRVVAANGLGGYGYGLDVKLALLEHEGVSW